MIVGGETRVDEGMGHDGTGKPVDSNSLFFVYCAAKPLLALMVGMLCDAGELSFMTDVRSMVPESSESVGDLTIEELLNHRACLVYPLGIEGIVGQAIMGEGLIESFEVGPGRAKPAWSGYSEFASWHLLAEIVKRVTGVAAGKLIEQEIVRPLNLSAKLVVDLEQFLPECGSRVRSNLSISGEKRVASLVETAPVWRRYVGNGMGAFATMGGLASFFYQLSLLKRGESSSLALRPETLAEMVATRQRGYDVLLRRKCAFGLGFMTDLQTHHFGESLSSSSFGHVGLMGMTVAFSDPDKDLAVAWHSNWMRPGDSTVGARRKQLVSYLYECLEG